MEKTELKILIRQLSDLMADVSLQLLEIKSKGVGIPAALTELIVLQIHTEATIEAIIFGGSTNNLEFKC